MGMSALKAARSQVQQTHARRGEARDRSGAVRNPTRCELAGMYPPDLVFLITNHAGPRLVRLAAGAISR